MKNAHLITFAALLAAGSAFAAEPPTDPVPKAQPSQVQRAEVIAETKRAMANGELKFGPLVDYQSQFAQSPTRSQPSARSSTEARGGVPQGRTVTMEQSKPADPAQPNMPSQPAQK